ncbi:exportin-5-like [Xenia sp. Carnegie-2017]|uniref:exportin-5-like n=1 Tax=Xenia sp. Carnegie-2017 TaxID=2897299 RepID=UPI001F03D8FC|nr:exportin-5-like [Xenia sp. Carnegie-2017]
MTLSDCSRLGEGYFCTPSLGEHVVSNVIEPWKHLPKYRLRNYIRHFLKMYCRVCPPSYYESALVPVIVVTFNQMIERLNKEWEAMKSREHIRTAIDDIEIVTEEDAVNNDEVIESQLVHLLTKNFIETLNSMCTMCRPSLREPYVEKKDESQAKLESADYVLQELPTFLLQHTETCKIVLLLPFIALRWPDVSSFTKAIRLCVPFIRQLIRNPPREVAMVPEMFEQIFTLALQGLQLMGHHVEIQSNLIRNIVIIYDLLRPLFPSLKNIMLQVPNIDTISLNKYDVTLMSNEELSEKEKKKIFKALLSGLIGKEVGKMFQYDIRILNLPSLPVVKREKSMNILATENNIGLTKLFEPEST